MRHLLAVVAVTAFVAVSWSPADEVPHFEFVRGLRSRQYPDLALEYLERLRSSNPPPAVAALIPLEAAKVRLDLASAENDLGRRLDLYNKARAEFQEFIARNPNNSVIGEARLELARVTVLQAKTQLGRAIRQESPADAIVARGMFVEANTQLKAVAAGLEKQLADPRFADVKTAPEKAAKAALEQARLQAELDIALNYLDQAQTYLDDGTTKILEERGKVVQQVSPLLDKVIARDPKHPLSWQARAWLGITYLENGDPKKARGKLAEVLDTSEPASAGGRRLARAFFLRILAESPEKTDGEPRNAIRLGAEKWLAEYRSFQNNPEGCGVRYQLAVALYELGADPMLKDRTQRGLYFTRARDLCRGLEQTDNDYTEKARLVKIKIFRTEGGDKTEIARIATFDDCLLRAQFEAAQIAEFSRKKDAKPEDYEKEQKSRLANAVAALERGLSLAGQPTAKVPPAEVTRARSLLTGYQLFTGKYKEAIEVGETTARSQPPTSQSASTAVYVLQAYSDLINKSLREGSSLADLEADGLVGRFRDLIAYMEKTWAVEPAGDLARHQKGLLLLKEKKLMEAYDVLATVSPRYAGTIFVKYQMAVTASQVAQEFDTSAKTDPDKAKRAQSAEAAANYEKRVLAALEALPTLPPGADGLTTATYLQARVEQGRALYRARKFEELEKLADPLLAALDKGEFRLESDARRAEARANLVLIKLYGLYGRAEAELAANRPAKVKELVDPLVNALSKGEYADLKKNPTLRWGLMGLTLRVHIQEGNTARALEILKVMQQFANEDEGAEGGRAVLGQLVAMVEKQIREVRRKKDAELTTKTLASFGIFLDELAKSPSASGAEALRLLADAYAGLDMHEKAVEIARKVTEPKGENGQPPDPRKTGAYRACRMIVVRELRLANKLDEAEAALKEIRETPWGKEHFEAEKERIHMIAARGKPGAAYTQWNALVGSLVRKITQPGVKEQYFECYYYLTEAYFRYGSTLPDPAKKRDAHKRAAGFIVKLEANFADLGGEESKARFDDLLEREPLLKEQYDLQKGAR